MSRLNLIRIAGLMVAGTLIFSLNACGGSGSRSLLQVSGPAISQQPVGPIIQKGENAALEVTASGSGSLSYQWFQGPSGTTTNPISGATSNNYTTPNLQVTSSYWVQVTDSNGSAASNTAVVLIAGPRQVQALMYTTQSNGSLSIKTPGNFLGNVLPNISGVSVSLPWNAIDLPNSDGTGHGSYNFAAFDDVLRPFLNTGRAVNLIVWPATEGNTNDPNNGGSTPAYVLSASYAASLNTTPQDMAVCSSYTGDSSNPYYSATQSGSGGSWNVDSAVTNAADISGLPVSYELPFMTAYQGFIQAVIQHYSGNPATPIGYIRFGFSQGGENSPLCNQYWPGYSKTVYLNYVQTMTDYVKQQNPSMTILGDLHAVGAPGSVDYGYADTEAADTVAVGFGFGTNGLQQTDITSFEANQPCDSDWCTLFTPAGGFSYNIALSLQTLQWTDPTGAAQTGSLTVLEPFAKAHATNNLELYQADVGLAFDPTNYCSYPHASCPANNTSANTTGYAGSIQDFLAP
ncbi:MAG TPA: hypothetical protein VGL72_29520 [Bryobacteraceae bacterium]